MKKKKKGNHRLDFSMSQIQEVEDDALEKTFDQNGKKTKVAYNMINISMNRQLESVPEPDQSVS